MTRRIQTTNPHERAFKLEWMDDPVEWDDDQTATVDDDVAERLVESDERPDISYAEADGERCTAIKESDGEVCGRPLPCRYHSDEDGDDDE